ncbi:MAG: PHP domain-containing protein [Clostridia bacterium]|nr:PHP domain-containing protein [Clostridia bacterium]
MRTYLLPETGNFYKSNLHCHTTISDGALTPEEIKRIYKEEGYSIVAYTDHNIMVAHQELRDENFLPLNGFEGDFNEGGATIDPNLGTIRCCHICFISPEEHNPRQLCFHRSEYLFHGNNKKNAELVNYDRNAPDYVRAYTPESINDYIGQFKDAGFFITYNHPTWSLETYREFSNYEGMDAMEIHNYGCYACGFDEENSRYYDDLLHLGRRIGCIAADDNHNHHPRDSAKWDSFGGFTYIKAPALTYADVFAALKRGDYYASRGPQITELYLEDGKVHIKCSPARRISLVLGTRRADVRMNTDGTLITEAAFDLKPRDMFFRITVWDEQMRPAYTRAYFMDEVR